jgi:hypothetical protein
VGKVSGASTKLNVIPGEPRIPALPGSQVIVTETFENKKKSKLTSKDIDELIIKMPGLTIQGVSPSLMVVGADVNDLFQKETGESDADYEARRILTLKIVSIPDFKVNNATALTLGYLMFKKAKLGLNYDPDIEHALMYIGNLLQR